MTDEEFYDAEIAPALADLSKRCHERGMSLLAMVTYDDAGSIGRTVALAKTAPFMIRMADALAQCWAEGGGVNVDGFIGALIGYAEEYGHSSVYLKMLGVPITPAAREREAGS